MNIINIILNKFGYKIYKLEKPKYQFDIMTLSFCIGTSMYETSLKIKHPDNPYIDYKKLHARLDKEHFDNLIK